MLRRLLPFLAGIALCLGALPCSTLAEFQERDTPTFRVYANLIQMPVLILGSDRRRIKQSVAERLSISIDSGPTFRPEHVRLEGDDPLSLTIVIDTGVAQEGLLAKIGGAIAQLAPSSLNVRDHVSIYALGCNLVRASNDAPADRAQLQNASAEALKLWRGERASSHNPACGQTVHLWDALAFVTNELSTRPGRGVVLVVSNGLDEGSSRKWNDLRAYAQSTSVTIFGLTYMAEIGRRNLNAAMNVAIAENLFASLCELSGGTVLWTSAYSVGEQLKAFVAMLRERYIVEFRRPWNATDGQHSIVVSVDRSDDFVRVTGTIVPLEDQRTLDDPATLPSDLSLTPTIGSRHPIVPPK